MTAKPALDTRPVVATDLVPGATADAAPADVLAAVMDDGIDADLCQLDVDDFLSRNPDLAFASVEDLIGDDWA